MNIDGVLLHRVKAIKKFTIQKSCSMYRLEDIAELRGLSKGRTHTIMKDLLKMGLVRRQDGSYVPTKKLSQVPYFESINAGFADWWHSDIEGWIDVPNQAKLKDPNHTIAVKVSGDSMQDKGIVDGSIVYIDNQEKELRYLINKVVAVYVDGSYCVKELCFENDTYLLRSHNELKQYPDIVPQQEAEIVGQVIAVYLSFI